MKSADRSTRVSARGPLSAFRRRTRHHRVPEIPRARTPSGTVHLVTPAWLPVCGAGLNSWDPHGLVATDDELTCRRCGDVRARREGPVEQLRLF